VSKTTIQYIYYVCDTLAEVRIYMYLYINDYTSVASWILDIHFWLLVLLASIVTLIMWSENFVPVSIILSMPMKFLPWPLQVKL